MNYSISKARIIKRKYKEARENGLCGMCKKDKALPSLAMCGRCRDRRNEAARKSWPKYKKQPNATVI